MSKKAPKTMKKYLPEDEKSSFFDGLLFKITLSPIGNNVEKNILRGLILERFLEPKSF
jgi:hypothetical protein